MNKLITCIKTLWNLFTKNTLHSKCLIIIIIQNRVIKVNKNGLITDAILGNDLVEDGINAQ